MFRELIPFDELIPSFFGKTAFYKKKLSDSLDTFNLKEFLELQKLCKDFVKKNIKYSRKISKFLTCLEKLKAHYGKANYDKEPKVSVISFYKFIEEFCNSSRKYRDDRPKSLTCKVSKTCTTLEGHILFKGTAVRVLYQVKNPSDGFDPFVMVIADTVLTNEKPNQLIKDHDLDSFTENKQFVIVNANYLESD